MCEIGYSKQAQKILLKIQSKIAKGIIKELNKISENPFSYKGDWKKMKGSAFWWVRKRSWRAIFEIVESKLIIYVLKIGSRGDIYK